MLLTFLFFLIIIVITFKEIRHNAPQLDMTKHLFLCKRAVTLPKIHSAALPTCLVSFFHNHPSLSCLQPPSRPWTLWYPSKSCATISNTLLFSMIGLSFLIKQRILTSISE